MMGITSKLNGYLRRDARRPRGRRLAAGDGQRLRDDRQRRLPQPPARDHEGHLPRRAQSELPARWKVHRVKAFEDGVTYEATKILEDERPGRHRHAREHRLPAGRQDRHDRPQHRRLVRRLHAAAVDGRLGRLPELARSR